MELEQNFVYPTQNVQAQAMPGATYNSPHQPMYYENQLPAAPAQSSSSRVLTAIPNARVAPMSISQPQAYTMPQTTVVTPSGKLSPCAIVAIVVATVVVLGGICAGIVVGISSGNCDYTCNNGVCIFSSWVCDGSNDCSDGEDEYACPSTVICSSSQFTCVNGGVHGDCIPASWECNNIDDCTGNTDEQSCSGTTDTGTVICSSSQFTCVYGGFYGDCIPAIWECDNVGDCTGSTDEQSCGGTTETGMVSMYQCLDDRNNTEISITQVCDGNSDCPGNADEERCIIMPSGNSAGQVQIYSANAGTYHSICGYGDGWTDAQSHDICVRLGYSGVVTSDEVTSTTNGLKCPGSTFDLVAHVQQIPSVCTNDKVMKIVCSETTSCGSSSRIVGGVNTTITAYPWQISLLLNNNGSWYHFCGGTIVNERWVVTAAHCVTELTFISLYRVLAGITTISGTIAAENFYSITKVVSHPLYDKTLFNMDIALIYVSTNFAYSATVQPACMPAIGQIFADNSNAHITGWGSTSEDGAISTTLQAVTVPYYNTESCRSIFTSLPHINDANVCAGVAAGGKGPCQGDSGGPLVIRSGGRDYLAGVTSFGVGCARPNSPGVYAEVSYFVDWIRAEFATP